MRLIREFENRGTEMSEKVGKMLVESIKESGDTKLMESLNFKEGDNTMGNSTSWYTTVLAKKIYYSAYNKFNDMFGLAWNLTPADLGMPEGAGAYKIPKVVGAVAVKLASGESVDYINDGKGEATLDTETYGIGTRINRRLLKRAAKGVINKLIEAGSESVLRAVATDLVNGIVAGAAAGNNVTGGIDYDAIEDAKLVVRNATNSKGVLFGFEPATIAFTNVGWNILSKSTDFKALVQYGSRNVPGDKVYNDYMVFNGLKVIMAPLISVTKAGNVVHAVVLDTGKYIAYLQETGMDTFDGRIPGTAGDVEIIHAMDAGFIVLADTAASVITAA